MITSIDLDISIHILSYICSETKMLNIQKIKQMDIIFFQRWGHAIIIDIRIRKHNIRLKSDLIKIEEKCQQYFYRDFTIE